MGKNLETIKQVLPFGVVLEECACPLGCKLEDDLVLVGRDRLHNLPGQFPVVKCRTCGLMRTNPRPTRDTISYYYPEDYGPFRSTTVDPSVRTPFWKRFISRLFPLNNDCIPLIKSGFMLEVGCASGAFLHHMAEKDWMVEGIEASATPANVARSLGYSVYVGSVEDAPEPTHMYDLIIAWMVVEHLHDPLASLARLRQWTLPGGWLAISVPNAGALEFRLFKGQWYALQLPTHLYHFTPQTLTQVLTASGWHVERVLHQRLIGNLAASTSYYFQDRDFQNRLTEWLIRFPEDGPMQYLFYPLGFLLGLFGQTGRMTIWARNLL